MNFDSWESTISKHKRRATLSSEMLIKVEENIKHPNNYWVYDLTRALGSQRGLSRKQLMQNVQHSIQGGNQVVVHIICDKGVLSFERATVIARRHYNGNSHTYRLDK